LEMPGGAK